MNELVNAINDLLYEITDFIFSRSQENLIKNGSIDTGILLSTANVNKKFLETEIVYPAAYAAAIEFGSMPHKTPLKKIQNPNDNAKKTEVLVPVFFDWTKRKLRKTDKEAIKTSWAIWQKIKENGTKPQPFLRPAIEQAKAMYGGLE